MPSNLARAAQRVEDLPDRNDRAFDTIAGSIVRLFSSVIAIEAALARLKRRVAALEGRIRALDEPAPATARSAVSIHVENQAGNGAPNRRLGERAPAATATGSFAKHY
jgi:hypothetical protein